MTFYGTQRTDERYKTRKMRGSQEGDAITHLVYSIPE